jgi:hypothetical protein
MLDIQTFDARAGGNVLYKALAHPLAAEKLSALFASVAARRFVVYDPAHVADALFALYPDAPQPAEVFVHDVEAVGQPRAGQPARALDDLPASGADAVLVAAFDAGRIADRIGHLLPRGAEVLTLDEVRLPASMLTSRKYLDRLNFATNFCLFRDEGGLSSRLTTANYWSGYGAGEVRLWLRLFGADGAALATWEQEVAPGASGVAIDSREVRDRRRRPRRGEVCA